MQSVGGSPSRGVLLITVDSLRADALGPHTPTLRGLARRGTAFETAIAGGNWTPFSFPDLLGARPVFSDASTPGPSADPTLAEALSTAGVRTAGVNAGNGFLTPHYGYDRGFDEFESFLDGARTPIGRFLTTHPTVNGWVQYLGWPLGNAAAKLRGRERRHAVDTSHLHALERRALGSIESFAGDDGDRPFFLWIHYMDAHTPYVPAPRHVKAVTDGEVGSLQTLLGHLRAGLGKEVDEETLRTLRALYDASVRQIDESVSRVLDELKATGMREDTTVILAGDHGEEFLDHGHLAHYPKLYDELVRVPFVVDHPGAPARTEESAVPLRDVPPTVCDALGVESPAAFAGESLLPTIRAEERPDRDPVTSLAIRGESVTSQPIPRRLGDGTPLVAARTRRWSYVRGPDGAVELFDRTADPGESDDAGREAVPEEAFAALERAADDRLALLYDAGEDAGDGGRAGGADGDGDGDGDDVPDAIGRRLEALGYR
ncbi:sulfatase-like hydrolase/transferase [Halobaculum sp. CBA1158]|uniref:sulfatase-like hydrolase/transferase n=1 Tax=Halobaculum sp. CBA1158 TaxID=2904243 RepID=UPI001F43991B|nr:sulfatase-like hydrolase/transferase [Halobaculum sp. CBA1158]UIP00376.1 sulfatase-like hydrolase/transferase [Halobaculum sp. CBA1158]